MVPNNVHIRRRLFLQSIQIFLIAFVLLVSPLPVLARSNSPVHNYPVVRNNLDERNYLFEQGSFSESSRETELPDFKSFVESVRNGQKGLLRGVYVPGVLALPVVQQPVGNPGFVSQNNDELTQFNMAAEVGNVGLLAHNYLSGAIFPKITPGQEVRLIYGDGAVEYFVVDQVLQYQALDPYNPRSDFRDLENNITISAEQLFRRVYRGERHVTFQTCIEANGNSSWGRLFITAQPKLFSYLKQQNVHDNLLQSLY